MKLKDKLETQEFYELMQVYRHSNDLNGKFLKRKSDTVIAFEAVKDFIKKPYKKIYY